MCQGAQDSFFRCFRRNPLLQARAVQPAWPRRREERTGLALALHPSTAAAAQAGSLFASVTLPHCRPSVLGSLSQFPNSLQVTRLPREKAHKRLSQLPTAARQLRLSPPKQPTGQGKSAQSCVQPAASRPPVLRHDLAPRMLALGLPGACSTSGTCTAPPQQARGRLGLARGLAPCRAVARWRDLPDGGTVTLAPYEGAEEAAAPAPPRMPRGSAVLAEAPAKLPLPANPGDVGSPSAVPLRSGSGVPDTARCLLRLHELCCAPEQPFSDWRLDGVTLNGGEQLRFATVGEALRAPEAAVAAASQAPAPAAPASAAPATTTAG